MNAGTSSKRSIFLVLALLALPIVFLCAVAMGTTHVPFSATLRVILDCLGLKDSTGMSPLEYTIIYDVRMPRVLLLALAGTALSCSGAALQATFHNPMASPSIIGVNSGGALGAVLAIALGWSDQYTLVVPLMAFGFALVAAMLVYALSYAGGRPSTSSLLLTGIAVGALMGALSSWVQTWTDSFRLQEIIFWMVGGARDRSWEHAGIAAPVIVLGVMALWLWNRRIDALALGDDHALSVGVAVHPTRLIVLTLCALVAGAAVSVCGPIAFVGLVIPHLVRLLVGQSSRYLIPSCALIGAQFLVICDLVARVNSSEGTVYLGVITALLGVPFFLWLLIRSKNNP